MFFEGPPTANGRPGIHHVFSRTIKDLFCRHRAMRGFRVARKAGWDTHGLPVEIEVEKRIETSSASAASSRSRRSASSGSTRCAARACGGTARTGRTLSERIGYWLDYSDPYVTYTNDYIESVWWALETLFRRGRLYRGHKILPYCARCGTALSSHEVAQGYEDVEDPSVYVALDLVRRRRRRRRCAARILVWTTTPWTLVSNVALAVHPGSRVRRAAQEEVRGDATRSSSRDRARAAVLGDDYAGRWDTVRHLPGSELVGMRYKRPLDWVDVPAKASTRSSSARTSSRRRTAPVSCTWRRRSAPTTTRRASATARLPAAGESARRVPGRDAARRRHVREGRRSAHHRGAEAPRRAVEGGAASSTRIRTAGGATRRCCTTRARRGSCARRSSRTRCSRATRASTGIRRRWATGRFGEWLKNNIDWAISRDRYWGTPLPVWVCDRDDDARRGDRRLRRARGTVGRDAPARASIRTSRSSTRTAWTVRVRRAR